MSHSKPTSCDHQRTATSWPLVRANFKAVGPIYLCGHSINVAKVSRFPPCRRLNHPLKVGSEPNVSDAAHCMNVSFGERFETRFGDDFNRLKTPYMNLSS